MSRDVKRWGNVCEKCVLAKAKRTVAHGKYGSIEVGKPHEVFGLDFYSIPETSQLNTRILTIIDMFSSYVKFVPCRDRTAEQFVEALQKEVIFKILGEEKKFDIETFTWEKLDCTDDVKSIFGL